MDKRLTSQDIARLAKVSQSTVSRVLRDLPSVKPDTRDHVLAIIKEHGYLPSAAARLMKTNRSGSVAVVVANLTNPLYPSLLQLLVGHLARFSLKATVWELQTDLDDAVTAAIAESAVDGVIFATAIDSTLAQYQAVARRKPVILMNRGLTTHAFDAIVSDNREGAASVAAYFARAGRKKVGLITADSDASTIKEREAGFLETMEQHGCHVTLLSVPRGPEPFTYENGYQAATELISLAPHVDTVFCTNDILAIGALDGAKAAGKRIPDDFWLVGYDDIPMAGWDSIGLTTVRQPIDIMTAMVVDRLLLRMKQADLPPKIVRLPNNLVLRRTTR